MGPGDEDVAVDGDHGDAEERDADAAVAQDGDDYAEHVAVDPGAVEELAGGEGEHDEAEHEVGDAQAGRKMSKKITTHARKENKVEMSGESLSVNFLLKEEGTDSRG